MKKETNRKKGKESKKKLDAFPEVAYDNGLTFDDLILGSFDPIVVEEVEKKVAEEKLKKGKKKS